MIYAFYLILAILIVFLSNKASEYVDLIDKKSTLSGAFIGGVIFSAVTSLPELFTSITSTIMLDKPGLCIGNILGSDLFNLMILAVLILLSYKSLMKANISKSHIKVTFMVCLIYMAILFQMMDIFHFEILTVSITTLLIFVFYTLGIRYMSSENGEISAQPENVVEDNKASKLSLRQVVIRFIIVSIGIIALSISITYVTDMIATKHNLGYGLAGALFLGIATSLPEVASTIALFRLKNYNIAISNIIGSNIFNLLILGIADVLYLGKGIYDFSDSKTINLLVLGAIATPMIMMILRKRNKFTVICPIAVILCYILFLTY